MSTSNTSKKTTIEKKTVILFLFCTYFIIKTLANGLIPLPSRLVAARRISNVLALNVQWHHRGYISSMECQGRSPMRCKGNCQRQKPCTPHPTREMHGYDCREKPMKTGDSTRGQKIPAIMTINYILSDQEKHNSNR